MYVGLKRLLKYNEAVLILGIKHLLLICHLSWKMSTA